VHPSALGRRREGVTRGSNRVAAGRPIDHSSKPVQKKRRRNSTKDVAANQTKSMRNLTVPIIDI